VQGNAAHRYSINICIKIARHCECGHYINRRGPCYGARGESNLGELVVGEYLDRTVDRTVDSYGGIQGSEGARLFSESVTVVSWFEQHLSPGR
jgi:hypothetical protein